MNRYNSIKIIIKRAASSLIQQSDRNLHKLINIPKCSIYRFVVFFVFVGKKKSGITSNTFPPIWIYAPRTYLRQLFWFDSTTTNKRYQRIKTLWKERMKREKNTTTDLSKKMPCHTALPYSVSASEKNTSSEWDISYSFGEQTCLMYGDGSTTHGIKWKIKKTKHKSIEHDISILLLLCYRFLRCRCASFFFFSFDLSTFEWQTCVCIVLLHTGPAPVFDFKQFQEKRHIQLKLAETNSWTIYKSNTNSKYNFAKSQRQKLHLIL